MSENWNVDILIYDQSLKRLQIAGQDFESLMSPAVMAGPASRFSKQYSFKIFMSTSRPPYAPYNPSVLLMFLLTFAPAIHSKNALIRGPLVDGPFL